jgi:hypothetical protein
MTAERLGHVVTNARAKLAEGNADYLDEAVVQLADRVRELTATVAVLETRIAALNELLGKRCPHGRVPALCDDCGTP